MKHKVLLGCVALACLGLVGGSLIAGSGDLSPNSQEGGPPVFSFDLIDYFVSHSTLQDATGFVATASGGSVSIIGRTSDCCIEGDLWRLALVGRRNEPGLNQIFVIDGTSNNCDADPDFNITVCPPDVFGPDATLAPPAGPGRIQALAVSMFGNDVPAGLGAGGNVQLETDGTFGAQIGPFTN